jgi:hypothetical protein
VSRINAQGQIVGARLHPDRCAGRMLTQPFGINEQGEIVGFFLDANKGQ